MTKLVAISGSQGSGKSTIIHKLEEAGFITVKRKSSRSILQDWGISLDDVNNDADLAMKFQDEIILRKFNDEHQAVLSSLETGVDVIFTERTYADLFTYALVNLGKYNELSDWVDQYYLRCMQYQQLYDIVYYLRAGLFNVVADGVRGANAHYSRMVDVSMLDLTTQMTLPSNLSVIDTPSLEQRVALIASQSTRDKRF